MPSGGPPSSPSVLCFNLLAASLHFTAVNVKFPVSGGQEPGDLEHVEGDTDPQLTRSPISGMQASGCCFCLKADDRNPNPPAVPMSTPSLPCSVLGPCAHPGALR